MTSKYELKLMIEELTKEVSELRAEIRDYKNKQDYPTITICDDGHLSTTSEVHTTPEEAAKYSTFTNIIQ